MDWFLGLIIAIAAGLLLVLFARRRRETGMPAEGRRRGHMETSSEIGVHREDIDPDKALYRDRLSGVERPRVGGSRALGALKDRSLRKDNLSKEVELAWEAAETIEFQPGAYAWPRDFVDERHPSSGDDRDKRPQDPKAFRDEQYFLPQRYGTDRLVLMARDPQWVYAYWEITHEHYRRTMERHISEWGLSRPALRLYDVTPGIPHAHLDVVVGENAEDWYVHVNRPRHTLIAELGRLYPGGFVPMLRSNPVTMPPRDYSMEIALEWSDLDWARLYGRWTQEYYVSSPMAWRQ